MKRYATELLFFAAFLLFWSQLGGIGPVSCEVHIHSTTQPTTEKQ